VPLSNATQSRDLFEQQIGAKAMPGQDRQCHDCPAKIIQPGAQDNSGHRAATDNAERHGIKIRSKTGGERGCDHDPARSKCRAKIVLASLSPETTDNAHWAMQPLAADRQQSADHLAVSVH